MADSDLIGAAISDLIKSIISHQAVRDKDSAAEVITKEAALVTTLVSTYDDLEARVVVLEP